MFLETSLRYLISLVFITCFYNDHVNVFHPLILIQDHEVFSHDLEQRVPSPGRIQSINITGV